MFTGIIEEVGTISSIKQSGNAIELRIYAKKILEDVQFGDSISVNGVCLTVTTFSKSEFQLDVMPETIKSTSLKQLKNGSKVNLERAMSAKGRFGGHFVSGHVDGIGIIKRIRQVDNARYYDIEVEAALLKYMILKGSVAVDGTSLTIFGVSDQSFTISLIPHTLSETILNEKGLGEVVNIECDMLGKYMEHFLHTRLTNSPKVNNASISYDMLKENGFV
ncbi:riboflavin synthase [Heyndrickxia sp. NPDC080065]|uniref:riboflavin synthase n=1 Tax=Heyndrickxia sp. NPDC080065 TaxID=3390568 RepID=UPI003D0712B5